MYTLAFFITITNAIAQSFYTQQIGSVVFNSSSIDSDSLHKRAYAELCNNYINRYYNGKKLPLIYLIVSTKTNSILYELAFDNLNGNSLKNKLYGRKGKYDIPGIRIVLNSNGVQKEAFLKTLYRAYKTLRYRPYGEGHHIHRSAK